MTTQIWFKVLVGYGVELWCDHRYCWTQDDGQALHLAYSVFLRFCTWDISHHLTYAHASILGNWCWDECWGLSAQFSRVCQWRLGLSADFADSALKDYHKAWYYPEGSVATRWYENGQDEFNLIADDPTFRSEDFNSQGWEIVSPNPCATIQNLMVDVEEFYY